MIYMNTITKMSQGFGIHQGSDVEAYGLRVAKKKGEGVSWRSGGFGRFLEPIPHNTLLSTGKVEPAIMGWIYIPNSSTNKTRYLNYI